MQIDPSPLSWLDNQDSEKPNGPDPWDDIFTLTDILT